MPVRPLGTSRWSLICKRLTRTDNAALLASRQRPHTLLLFPQSSFLSTHERHPTINATQSLPLPLTEHISLSLRLAHNEQHEELLRTRSATVYDAVPSNTLPLTCPGCGAFSHEAATAEPGYYTRSRKAVKDYLRNLRKNESIQADLSRSEDQGEIDEVAVDIANLDDRHSDHAAVDQDGLSIPIDPKVPLCDRCHDLMYNHRGVSIAHPTIDAIADSIAESPHRRNHVYHVLDAADFPMSLIPSIHKRLVVAKPRSQNRRSQHDFSSKPTLSFIITRSDLLGTSKEIVDSLMPYFASVLREALGRAGRDIRLGNVHLVSAKRGWWTKDIKDSIWKRGGGNWMVGKVNVGKSNLFEVLFPKGSGERAPSRSELVQGIQANSTMPVYPPNVPNMMVAEDSLLPPVQLETPFPGFPLVSSLPGTTASPIRLPFGNTRGELVDLPGLARSNLDEFVQNKHKLDLVMQHRPNVKQHVIKTGQSLLLGGGLVRITPMLDEHDPSLTMLAYPFVPLKAHVTSTTKAEGEQLQQRESGIRSILADGVVAKMKCAGQFKLDTDVTKSRARTLLNANVPLEKLPFRVYSTDVLIEGVGWVELVCQVRRRRRQVTAPPASARDKKNEFEDEARASLGKGAAWNDELIPDLTELDGRADEQPASPATPQTDTPPEPSNNLSTISTNPAVAPSTTSSDHFFPTFTSTTGMRSASISSDYPTIEIHTPNGAHVATRRPMGAWMLLEGARKLRARKAGPRKRKPMKGMKKQMKIRSRMGEAGR